MERREGLAERWGAPTHGWALPSATPAHQAGTALGQSENSCSWSVFFPFWGLRAPWVELRTGLRPAALKLNFCSWRGSVGGLCGICWWDVLQGLLFSLPGGNWGLFSSKPSADGALGGWLCPGFYWWLHLGFVAAESHKEITTPKNEAGADGVSISHCGLNNDCVSVLCDHSMNIDF